MSPEASVPVVPTEQISLKEFQQAQGTSFRVLSVDPPALALVLAKVAVVRSLEHRVSGDKAAAYENFSLFFDGPAERLLPQRTYRLEHSRLGVFDLFIVPVAQERGLLRYEAVFNRRAAVN
jgi:hypothetical protein